MAKVIYAVPPLTNPKGYATVGQNRQFQVLKDPTFVYPMIPAFACTMLAQAGHNVLWLDAIAEEMNELEFGRVLVQQPADYIIFECPTPLIDRYTEVINGIKDNVPDVKIILCGEHISAVDAPDCKADYKIKGGKWYADVYKIIHGSKWKDDLPMIDRNLTRWWLYGYKNGNFRSIPATYIMSSLDCWYGKCNFCAWSEYHKECYTRPVDDVLDEIEHLINMGFKEIFDDSGTFPVGAWLKELCEKAIDRGYAKYISFGCNMRFGVLTDEEFDLMKKAGFRMILWGCESVNQNTLDRLNKGIQIKDIQADLIKAKSFGFDSHITCMFGYWWENDVDAKRTYDMVRYWLLHDYLFSAQATLCIPYPITPLWKQCQEKKVMKDVSWLDYDMSQLVNETACDEEYLKKLQAGIYNVAFHPKFIWNKLWKIRNFSDFKYYMRIARKIYDRFGNFYVTDRVAKG